MSIDRIHFQSKSNDIKQYMAELNSLVKSGQMPSDQQIWILGQKFFERDKDIDAPVDIEMLHVIRGFEWGMRAMRQIIEGNNLN